MKMIVALILILLGLAGGAGLGVYLKPPDLPAGADGAAAQAPAKADRQKEEKESAPPDYVKLGRQIVVPVVEGGETRALMLFELALDMAPGTAGAVFTHEPRLRDAFLRDFFAMSHTGAFLTTYTDDRVIEELRAKLLDSARAHLGDDVRDILMLEVIRQEY